MQKLDELNYVDQAEKVIKSLIVKDRRGNKVIYLTTSKIRNLLSMISEIYNEVVQDKSPELSVEIQGRIQYLKIRFAYEAGRDTDRGMPVKNFVKKANIFEHIEQIGNSRERLLIFCRYMEALVAYHRFYGGRQ